MSFLCTSHSKAGDPASPPPYARNGLAYRSEIALCSALWAAPASPLLDPGGICWSSPSDLRLPVAVALWGQGRAFREVGQLHAVLVTFCHLSPPLLLEPTLSQTQGTNLERLPILRK